MYKEEDIKIRKANESDAELYFEWVNDELVRGNSFSSETILYENHLQWFKAHLSDPHTFMYVFEIGRVPVGQVRIEAVETPLIDISLDKSFRGKGLGSMIISSAVKMYFIESGDTKPVTAYIKSANAPSVLAFTRAGFVDLGEDSVNGIRCRKLQIVNSE